MSVSPLISLVISVEKYFHSVKSNLENEAIVENVADTTLDKTAPTKDLPLSSESLYAEITALSPTANAQ